jgi:hypothetical protein
MKKIDEIKNQEWYLGESELERIKFIIEELTFFTTHKKITEEALRKFKNMSREIQNLEDLINDRIINLLKQHHMID